MSDQVRVPRIPTCDVCRERPAVVDAAMRSGPWAYLCEPCWRTHCTGQLGTGYGQRLMLDTSLDEPGH